jgi:hypothetical protein
VQLAPFYYRVTGSNNANCPRAKPPEFVLKFRIDIISVINVKEVWRASEISLVIKGMNALLHQCGFWAKYFYNSRPLLFIKLRRYQQWAPSEPLQMRL